MRIPFLPPKWAKDKLWTKAREVPSLDLRFAESKSLVDATTGANLVTFTRASSATFVDSQGVIQTAGNDVPRFTHNPVTGESLGLLVEEARTNSIRNNTMVGAVAGTPGTLPANWFTATALTGITSSVISVGTENGIAYIDIQLAGTPSAAGAYGIGIESNTVAAALTGQTWTESMYYKLIAGSLTGISSFEFRFNEFTSGGAFISGQSSSALPSPTGADLATQRVNRSVTLSGGATTAFLNAFPRLNLSGTPIDITLRIGLPQLEQGAFATSPILTSGTAVTRTADVCSISGSNFGAWYRQDEGTVFADFSPGWTGSASSPTSNPGLFSVNDAASGTFNGYGSRLILNTTASLRWGSRSGGTTSEISNAFTGFLEQRAIYKFTGAYASNLLAQTVNGGATVQLTDANYGLMTINRLQLGCQSVGGSPTELNGTIRRLTYWPQRLSNSTLQEITR